MCWNTSIYIFLWPCAGGQCKERKKGGWAHSALLWPFCLTCLLTFPHPPSWTHFLIQPNSVPDTELEFSAWWSFLPCRMVLAIFVCFHCFPGNMICMCAHICVEDEEKGEEKEKREKGRYSFFLTASPALAVNAWWTSGSCVAFAQISWVGSAISEH